MRKYPKILNVDTGYVLSEDSKIDPYNDIIDYHVYDRIPYWWRRLEKYLRLDIYLALQAKRLESQYDIIWAMSEKVGIPLSFVGLKKPLIVVAHHMESPIKARFARYSNITKNWIGIGYVSNESKEFFIDYLGVPIDRLFQYESAKYLDKVNMEILSTDGPIMSLGVAKRDYYTLITALANLNGYRTDLFVSSKFGDMYLGRTAQNVPEWIQFREYIPEDELIKSYYSARFVIVPLEATTHTGAGINVILEAGAFGKAVIATDTGGMRSFVKSGETGILVPPYDVEALRNAIHQLWTRPDMAKQMGLAGRRYIETYYNPKEVNAYISAFFARVYNNSMVD